MSTVISMLDVGVGRERRDLACSGFSTSTVGSSDEVARAQHALRPTGARAASSAPRACRRSRTSFRFSTMSVTSSMHARDRRELVQHAARSCTDVIAAPWSDDSSTRRSALPSVVPKPRSSGSHAKLPVGRRRGSSSTSSARGRISSRQFFGDRVRLHVVPLLRLHWPARCANVATRASSASRARR